MHIGGLKPCNNVFLAPMAGVTDLPMRELAVELGAGMAVGEMQSADLSLARSRKTTQRQRHSARAGPRSLQIVGYDPQQLADAARVNADLGADIIDINMGCPAKKVCRRAAADFFSRAAHVDVDDVGTQICVDARGVSQLLGVVAHNL